MAWLPMIHWGYFIKHTDKGEKENAGDWRKGRRVKKMEVKSRKEEEEFRKEKMDKSSELFVRVTD